MNFKSDLLDNGGTLISVEITEAGLNHSEEFKTFLIQNLSKTNPKMVIDLGKVQYMDSSFIGALVSGLKSVIALKGEMVLADVKDDVLALFELTRLDKVFKIFKNTSEASSYLS